MAKHLDFEKLLRCFFLFSFFISPLFVRAEPEAVPGEYLVRLKNSIQPNSASQKISAKVQMKGFLPGARTFHVQLKKSSSGAFDAAALDDLKNNPDVEYVEPNYILRKADTDQVRVLGEAELTELASESSSGGGAVYSQSKARVQASEAWQSMSPIPSSQEKVIVAIIDTGIDLQHELFLPVGAGGTGAIWENHREIPGNRLDDDYNGYPDDINGWNYISSTGDLYDDDGHGTHVAGIVLGTALDIFSYQLPESPILLMPLKFLDGNGAGTTANAIRAIYYAVDNGARVINNSWGGGAYSRALHDAYKFAYDHKVILISAAGNSALNNDTNDMYPANLDTPSNLAVAASDDQDRLAGFSDFGSSKVHLASPGTVIVSSYPGNRYAMMSGTSMAAPFVAGVAALAIREAPELTGYQIKQALLGSVDTASSLAGKVYTGGRVNVLKAVQMSIQNAGATPFQPDYQPSYQADRSPASSGSASAKGAGCGMVSKALLEGPGSFSKGPSMEWTLVTGLLIVPLILWALFYFHARSTQGADGRRYDRYQLSSQVRVNVGGQVITGSLSTISVGGAAFDVNAALEKGGVVKMQIQSPDGNESIEVEGRVVWSKENHAYGLQFTNAHEGVRGMIEHWTKGRVPAS